MALLNVSPKGRPESPIQWEITTPAIPDHFFTLSFYSVLILSIHFLVSLPLTLGVCICFCMQNSLISCEYLEFYVFLQHAPNRMKQPGEITERTVLNVFASPSNGKRYILDSLKVCPFLSHAHATNTQT